ncbi:bacteriocin secretion accessory protein [Streptococcus equi subsp. zooepidemicus]|uniref:bacteriocin secretion accessory protein n=2 Tax=Streptococcus equi TaxID=1336 RepID=UPI0002174447|nr:bacteriocin secretion accessory protein [Streptococcus equi]AEJ24929.1 transport protein ComB [Streptococcus equi subsp. zooepidemicus ATCC 35246]MCD3442765.1 bacteriocin secretion accessory protein [Streptococcus equi subsp. zooepidemicus]NMW55548.1 bacteriocin secretion accessory protein [Streptococcus equi subsp. zooepidemicus]NPU62844.1 bacteriocin secretion accessory protein [Streptococcus equi subsp. zooepidemicus]QGM13553.1 bacteriocin secretion accessory protein [Streptococcus equi 
MYEELLESSEFYQKRYHNFSSRIILPIFGLLIFLVIFLAFMKKEVTLKSQATVEPVKVLAQIQSTSNNTIKTNNLQENKLVNKDDLLIEYETASEMIQHDSTQDQLNNLKLQKEQLELLKSSVESGISQFPQTDSFGYYKRFEDYLNQRQTLTSNIEQQNGTIASQNAASQNAQNTIGGLINDTTQKIANYEAAKSAIQNGQVVDVTNPAYSIYSTYIAQSATLLTDVEKTTLMNQVVAQLDSQIQQYQTELSNYQIQYSGSGTQQAYNSSLDSQLASLQSQKIAEISQELTALDQKIKELNGGFLLQENTLKETKIKASVAGIVHVNPEVIDSTIIPEGTVIAQIFPKLEDEKAVKIETYISSRDITSLKIGDTVKFKTQDSSNKEVTLKSKITSIDSSATKTKEGSYFKVVSEAKLSNKELKDLKYGSSGDLVVVTGEKTYLKYYLDKFLN